MEVCGLAIKLQFAESVPVVCYEYLAMTSPSSMLVPDHCVCKAQHSTFDDSRTRSYLPGAWEKLAGNVEISIINLCHMCAYSAILRLKMINKSIEAIELSKIPRDIWARVALSEIIPPHRFQTGWCWSPISGSYPGYWACRIYIYRWMVRPLWIHIIYFASSGGWRLPVKPNFFSFFFNSHSQHCLKMCVSCC